MHLLSTSIEYLKGVGPTRSSLLKNELSIYTFEDLLYHFPFRYIDKSKFYKISELQDEMPYVQIKAKIISIEEKGHKRSKRLTVCVRDETSSIELVWFKGLRWIRSSLKLNGEYIFFGKPTLYSGRLNIAHPEIDVIDKENHIVSNLQPVYHSTEKLNSRGLSSRNIAKLIKNLLEAIKSQIEETLSDVIINRLNLPSRKSALCDIHFPVNIKILSRASKRLKFDEFFFLQLHLIKIRKLKKNKYRGYQLDNIGPLFNNFYNNFLPFKLTSAQKRVVKEIRSDVKKSQQMNRLLQGDVGSGKTLVALLSMLMAVDNNYQTCLMAPTEILAQQHFETIKGFLKEQEISVALLTGSTKSKERRKLHQYLESGEINILIGTHALLEDKVMFSNLAFVVIDEQHRFGVAQRAKLWKKNVNPPHILVMTATPIPRTLSMTVYGDLDVSIIDELPPGRKPVKTIWKTDSSRLQIIKFMREQINLGRQIYIVFPLIDESEKLDYKNLIEGFNSIQREFPLPDFQVSVVHGKMSSEDKEYEMNRFIEGITNIMVATTAIEVGVDVANASVMIIESAERFGLSQLHQLRGRVGRGSNQSYCLLVSGNKLSSHAKTRLSTMVETNDGFRISEVDLKLRGPGDMMSTKQSGVLDFKIADLIADSKILEFARKEAKKLLSEDLNLEKVENINIARVYRPYARKRMGWSSIS
jgi:ATP-dependent DNA helicase RecG